MGSGSYIVKFADECKVFVEALLCCGTRYSSMNCIETS